MKNTRFSLLIEISFTFIVLVIATLIGFLIKEWKFHETNIVLIYVFSILLISRFTSGYIIGICASIISLLLFNWFFTEPYFTFKVYDLNYLITFAIMMFTSIVTSALTTKFKKVAFDAKEREKESNALYQMTNHLTDAEDNFKVGEIIVRTTSDILLCNTACIMFDEKGNPERTFLQRKDDGSVVRRELENGIELKKRMQSVHGFVDITSEFYYYPIFGNSVLLAVLSISSEIGEKMVEEQKRMLHSIIESASLALSRLRSFKAQAKIREEASQERYRGNLLRAISHDIRTPLAGIMGTSEMLMGKTDADDSRYALAKDIYQDALWLHGFVENILNLTKLQDGKMVIKKELEAVEEVIGAALTVMERRNLNRVFNVDMPESILMAYMDASLISQVLINLLDNAIKHSGNDCEITVSVQQIDSDIHISVLDRGCGISEKDLPYIFQIFYTTGNKSPDSKRGVGLGLAICQSIVEAHGGHIFAKNREGGGAVFTFTLPNGGYSDEF